VISGQIRPLREESAKPETLRECIGPCRFRRANQSRPECQHNGRAIQRARWSCDELFTSEACAISSTASQSRVYAEKRTSSFLGRESRSSLTDASGMDAQNMRRGLRPMPNGGGSSSSETASEILRRILVCGLRAGCRCEFGNTRILAKPPIES
jgi:hypothetical protein